MLFKKNILDRFAYREQEQENVTKRRERESALNCQCEAIKVSRQLLFEHWIKFHTLDYLSKI